MLLPPEAESKIQQLIMGGNHSIVIDLKDLNYISSAGLRIFLAANKLVRKSDGEIRFVVLIKQLMKYLKFPVFMIFKHFPDLESAIKDFHV